MIKRALRNIRGYSLLEQALILPFLLTFILGSADIMHILHARAAVKEGVRAAQRCAYPIGGNCVEPAATNQEARFAVSSGRPAVVAMGELYKYSGEAFWLSQPQLIFAAQATIISNAVFEQPSVRTYAAKTVYPTTAHLSYAVRTAFLPNIVGAFPDGITITYGRNPQSTSVEPTKVVSLSNSRITTSSSDYSSWVTSNAIHIAPPFEGEASGKPCYISRQQNGSAPHQPNFDASCASSWPWGAAEAFGDPLHPPTNFQAPRNDQEVQNFTYAVLYITGTTSGSEAGAEGVLDVSLQYPSQQTRSLGGRILSASSSGDLVPRGAPTDNYSDNLTAAYPREVSYHQAIRLPYNRPIYLKFAVVSTNGRRIAWQGDKVRIYTPRYEFVSDDARRCDTAVSRSEMKNLRNCSAGIPLEAIEHLSQDLLAPIVKGVPIQVGCYPAPPAESEWRESIAANQDDYELLKPDPSAICKVDTIRYQCPDLIQPLDDDVPNHGITASAVHGMLQPSQEALTVCPVKSDWAADAFIAPRLLGFEEQTITLNEEISWPQPDCSTVRPAPFILAPQYTNFKKFSLSELPTVEVALYTGDQDPRELKDTPKFGCAEFALQNLTYGLGNASAESGTLFAGLKPDLGCDWEEKLAEEATEKLSLPRNAFLVAARALSGSYKIGSRSIDSCMQVSLTYTNEAEFTELGVFCQSRIPDVCRQSETTCRYDFVGFCDESKSSKQGADLIGLSRDKIRDEFQTALMAAFPKAESNCAPDQNYCPQLQVVQQNDAITISGQLQLPVRLLLNRTVKIAYTETETSETAFAALGLASSKP